MRGHSAKFVLHTLHPDDYDFKRKLTTLRTMSSSRKITVENSWVEGAPAYALDEHKGWVRVRVSSVAGDKVQVKDGKR